MTICFSNIFRSNIDPYLNKIIFTTVSISIVTSIIFACSFIPCDAQSCFQFLSLDFVRYATLTLFVFAVISSVALYQRKKKKNMDPSASTSKDSKPSGAIITTDLKPSSAIITNDPKQTAVVPPFASLPNSDPNMEIDRLAKERFIRLQKAAEQNVPKACFDLALCYEKGTGTPKDLVAAFNFYLKAALLKVPEAIFNVALCYTKGKGTEPNSDLAFTFFQQAAQLKIPRAIYKKGLDYYKGRNGLPKDMEKAYALLCHGHGICIPAELLPEVIFASFNIADFYLKEERFSKNHDKALNMFLLALAQNVELPIEVIGIIYPAISRLCHFYSNGEQIPKKPERLVILMQHAVKLRAHLRTAGILPPAILFPLSKIEL